MTTTIYDKKVTNRNMIYSISNPLLVSSYLLNLNIKCLMIL